MNTILWTKSAYRIDGRSQFLVSGEFHYFRVPRADWRQRLELFREAGGNCVATYIPWILHEPVEGDIRFGDLPERDLESFLQLCRELGLYAIVRPGPYQYSEMKYCGLPEWLVAGYPQILARNVRGEPMTRDSVSYLHPVFLEKAKRWYAAVCPLLARHDVHNGGPVVFAQFDNELTGIHEWFGGWDYHPDTMGFGREDGRYARYLQSKYADIAALNAAYGTAFARFADVRPPDVSAIAGRGDRRRVKDYQTFYFTTITEYAVLLTEWMREAGIRCAFIHNSANPGSNAYHIGMAERLGDDFILGSDHYYNLDMDWNANNPTPKYAVGVLFSNETLRHLGYPPTVCELPAGSPSDWPPITPRDLQCCYMTNIAYGMKGFNYYVFAGGYNPADIGGDGPVYDYQAAIAPDNTVRPHYETLKRFGLFLRDNGWLAEAERICDFSLGLDRDALLGKYCASGMAEFGSADALAFLQKGLTITSLCASYSPELLDLQSEAWTIRTDKPLLVATSVNMAASVQMKLVRFVQNGGRLLLAPVIPELDDDFNPCTILRDFLGQTPLRRFDGIKNDISVGPVRSVHANGALWTAETIPDDAAVIASDRYTGQTVGWERHFPQGGCVVWLGMSWRFGKLGHMAMLEYLLQELRCDAPVVRCDNPNVWTALRGDGRRRMLFLINLFASPMRATVRAQRSDGAYTEPESYRLEPMEVVTVPLA